MTLLKNGSYGNKLFGVGEINSMTVTTIIWKSDNPAYESRFPKEFSHEVFQKVCQNLYVFTFDTKSVVGGD